MRARAVNLVMATSMFAVMALVAAPAAYAETICFRSGTVLHVASDAAAVAGGGMLEIARAGQDIVVTVWDFNGNAAQSPDCGSTVADTNAIIVTGTESPQIFIISMSGGKFVTPDGVAITFSVDMVASGQTERLVIGGSARSDTVRGGTNGLDLDGADGLDTTVENVTALSVSGHEGSDVITMTGGSGLGSPIALPFDAAGGPGADTIRGGDRTNDILGGPGPDRLHGGPRRDHLGLSPLTSDPYENGGDDRMYGYAGADKLYGQGGEDVLRGGDGPDESYGGPDADAIEGGAGDDDLFGGAGGDDLRGNGGDDLLNGGDGRDSCAGGDGRDTVRQCE
jgi:Ca2+-binding RTX toxin-like protein